MRSDGGRLGHNRYISPRSVCPAALHSFSYADKPRGVGDQATEEL